jgi:hypothetical protein
MSSKQWINAEERMAYFRVSSTIDEELHHRLVAREHSQGEGAASVNVPGLAHIHKRAVSISAPELGFVI